MDYFEEAAMDELRKEEVTATKRARVVDALRVAQIVVEEKLSLPPTSVRVSAWTDPSRPEVVVQVSGYSDVSIAAEQVFGDVPEPRFFDGLVEYVGRVFGVRVEVYGRHSPQDRLAQAKAAVAALEAEGVA